MYKLIACDLDETLIDDDAHVCQRNIDAIKAATKLGVKFVPATGRGYGAIGLSVITLLSLNSMARIGQSMDRNC